MELFDFLNPMVEKGASDLHATVENAGAVFVQRGETGMMVRFIKTKIPAVADLGACPALSGSSSRRFSSRTEIPGNSPASASGIAPSGSEVRSRRPRGKWKPVTFKQMLESVAMVLVFHLSSFTYKKHPKGPQARVARILAALAVRLADTVTHGGIAIKGK